MNAIPSRGVASLARRGAPVFLLLGLVCCTAAPTTFVLAQAQKRSGFDTYQIQFTPLGDDKPFDADLKESFELGLFAGLQDVRGLRALTGNTPDESTLVIQYRAAGLSEGSLAARAGTAAVNAFLPVGVVPEVGGGDLAIQTTFLDARGALIGQILVQCEVTGLFKTDAGTMRQIGVRTAEFVGSRFARSAPQGPLSEIDASAGRKVINLSPERARAELVVFEPLIGEWDLKLELRLPGAAPVFFGAHESARWEAGGRVFYQYTETREGPEQRFRYNLILWDPVKDRLGITSLDSISIFGAHTSHDFTVERVGNVIKGVATEPERVTEFSETLSDDGKTRRGSKMVWSADRKRLLLTVLLEGTRQGAASR